MATRRKFLKNGLRGGRLHRPGPAPARAWPRAQDTTDEEARNKAVVRRFKESQGTDGYEQVLAEVQWPDYRRLRSGFENLAANAAGSELAEAAQPVRTAFPDRADSIDLMIADGGHGRHAIPGPGDARRQFLRHPGDRENHRHYRSPAHSGSRTGRSSKPGSWPTRLNC